MEDPKNFSTEDGTQYPAICPYCKQFEAQNEKDAWSHLDGTSDSKGPITGGCEEYHQFIAYQEAVTKDD